MELHHLVLVAAIQGMLAAENPGNPTDNKEIIKRAEDLAEIACKREKERIRRERNR